MKSNPLGRVIRDTRTMYGLTLNDVSANAGVSTNYLSRVETGRVEPRSDWVRIVLTAMGEIAQSTDRAA